MTEDKAKTARPTSLDPSQFKRSPYDPGRIPPPLPDELRRLGVFPAADGEPMSHRLKSDEKAVQIQARVPPAILYAVDRLIESRAYNIRSRQEFFRTALANLAVEMADEVQQGHVRLLVRRLEEQRRMVAELRLVNDADEMADLTRKAAKGLMASGNAFATVQALRTAKRFAEDLPYAGLRARFEEKVGGAPGEDDVGAVWARVLSGELDKDDEELVEEKVKIY